MASSSVVTADDCCNNSADKQLATKDDDGGGEDSMHIHNRKVFRIDTSKIESVPHCQQNVELQDLDLHVYDQDTFEQGYLMFVFFFLPVTLCFDIIRMVFLSAGLLKKLLIIFMIFRMGRTWARNIRLDSNWSLGICFHFTTLLISLHVSNQLSSQICNLCF